MRIADYQVSSVIRSYMKLMKVRASKSAGVEEEVVISEEGKSLLLGRIETQMSKRINKQLRHRIEGKG